MYRVLCKLESSHTEEWFKVSDITFLTYQEEKDKHITTKMEVVEAPVSESSHLCDIYAPKLDHESNTSRPLYESRGAVK